MSNPLTEPSTRRDDPILPGEHTASVGLRCVCVRVWGQRGKGDPDPELVIFASHPYSGRQDNRVAQHTLTAARPDLQKWPSSPRAPQSQHQAPEPPGADGSQPSQGLPPACSEVWRNEGEIPALDRPFPPASVAWDLGGSAASRELGRLICYPRGLLVAAVAHCVSCLRCARSRPFSSS